MSRKLFPCGHKGKGKYCHRCEQEKKLLIEKKNAQKEHEEWESLFERDPVDLRPLEKKVLVDKARDIIEKIYNGVQYLVFKGKRLRYDRNVVSIPINRDYRLIFHDIDGVLHVHKLMKHEDYNVTKPG